MVVTLCLLSLDYVKSRHLIFFDVIGNHSFMITDLIMFFVEYLGFLLRHPLFASSLCIFSTYGDIEKPKGLSTSFTVGNGHRTNCNNWTNFVSVRYILQTYFCIKILMLISYMYTGRINIIMRVFCRNMHKPNICDS